MSADALERIDVTVTFLEMDTPPAYYPSLPYNRQIALLKTRAIPLHFYRYLQDRVGRKWQWVNVLRLNDEELSAGLHREDRDIRVLYVDGAPAGFFDIKPHLPDEVELAYFGMMEHATGQGIGRWFLGAAIEACWSHKPRRVTVQTCTLDHPAALSLYQKLGFRPVAQKKEVVVPLSFADRSASVMR
ncbi:MULTISPECIES: GNAT family N-acetyltransferase [Phyllobacteriaceae]|jgi:GNAT superfamily N-acetyltransferase|uniref:GNAT family N-acetyltransferase n=1 Tax=Mesorhizobium hungaricum TaxID=1566387 RepID=A0A1C2EB26_9HYPH|nr:MULTISPECIES: GNAT family N-acetyltransferase [Mesorhizobium]MBN9235241.1 GNAT family N-acetyltransferase [Mesorhizobium sp.]MDQ0332838.1 GNAT superfamily N-acetyltransferase [Mesorhizobium sp. YL-MeA3-2017]OCX24149.1 GNAT family N-acetyltransferase [Mesorhizobium hungaricum]